VTIKPALIGAQPTGHIVTAAEWNTMVVQSSQYTQEVLGGGNPDKIPAAAIGPDMPRPNYLINSGFELWQRGIGPFTAGGVYTADRWTQAVGSPSTLSTMRTGASGAFGSYSAQMTYTHAVGGSAQLLQYLEDYLQFRTLPVTVTAGVRATCPVSLFVNDGVGGAQANHPGDGSLQFLTCSFTPVSGALQLLVYFGANTASGVITIDNVMLTLGSTPVNYVPVPAHEEMRRCQRYYEVHGGVTAGFPNIVGNAAGANNYVSTAITFASRKALQPTMTKTGTWVTSNCGQPSFDSASPAGYRMYVTSSAAGNIGVQPADASCTVIAESNP